MKFNETESDGREMSVADGAEGQKAGGNWNCPRGRTARAISGQDSRPTADSRPMNETVTGRPDEWPYRPFPHTLHTPYTHTHTHTRQWTVGGAVGGGGWRVAPVRTRLTASFNERPLMSLLTRVVHRKPGASSPLPLHFRSISN